MRKKIKCPHCGSESHRLIASKSPDIVNKETMGLIQKSLWIITQPKIG